ncbi:hypothetical protein ElyMa_000153500 [Elysia marginata]|uniref:TIR domain-containing protein n=1 Tax=Elysia marginata TaxID=1093978 RepID=A0AAV4ESE5_9GAST|nr:hypothetical protein ElyMa_000153500 [Elysia marginata]
MGAGPSTPSVRCMSTAETVQGFPRLTIAQQTAAQSASRQQHQSSTPSLDTKTLPAMNTVTNAGSNTGSPGSMKTSKTLMANGSPAKRPTAFVNLPRTNSLNVRYDGLLANKTMEARRLEAQGRGTEASKNVVGGSRVRDGQNSDKASPTQKPQLSQPEAKHGHVSIKVEACAKEKNCENPVAQTKEDVSKSSEVQQNGVEKTSEKPADSSEPVETQSSPEKKTSKLKKTPEKIAEKFEAGLTRVKAKCDLLPTIAPRDLEEEGAPYTHDFRQCVLVLANSYFYFRTGEVPLAEILRYRACVAENLCREDVLNTILDTVVDSLKRKDCFSDTGVVIKDFYLPLKYMVFTLINYSDFCEAVKFNIAEHKELIPEWIKMLESYKEPHMNKALSDEQEKLLKWTLSILHNCGSLEENVPRLRDLNIIPLLLSYIDSPLAAIRLSSIATLADIVNESEAELLSLRPRIFSFILQKVERALKVENHRDVGWSVEELLRAVRQLARNDANKAILVDKGCLPVLLESIQVGNNAELQEALDCLWNLSFDDSNKQKIVDEPGLVQAVCDKYHAATGRVGHSCHGILWSLREVLLERDELKAVATEILSLKSQATPKVEYKAVVEDVDEMSSGVQYQGHLMISYQWANQEAIKRICAELRTHGIPVWIDIDYMGGSTLQAMAQAVEDSFAVIIAMSQKYKDSPNTRAEAEYTFQQRKPIIPLIMQNGYRPDGWLGLILGSKLYYDFSGKYSFESRMDGLLKAILTVAKRGGGDAIDGVDQPLVATRAGAATLTSPSVLTPPAPLGRAPVLPRQPASAVNEQKIRSWGKDNVNTWLAKFQLEGSSLKDLSGEEIVFMHNLKYEAPEFFYNCLDKKLNVTSLLDLANASKAFEDLSTQA